MPFLHAFMGLEYLICRKDNYVPRDYQTIDSMWTVDTWKYKDVTCQRMDEGYTCIIISDNVIATRLHDDTIKYDKGSGEDLINLLQELSK